MESVTQFTRDVETVSQVYFWFGIVFTTMGVISSLLSILWWIRCAFNGVSFAWQNLWAISIMGMALATLVMGSLMIYFYLL